jgi:hypothetical protein
MVCQGCSGVATVGVRLRRSPRGASAQPQRGHPRGPRFGQCDRVLRAHAKREREHCGIHNLLRFSHS